MTTTPSTRKPAAKKAAPKKAAPKSASSATAAAETAGKSAASKAAAAAKSFPAFDFSKFELPKFDMPKFELPKFDMPKINLPGNLDTDKFVTAIRDAAYTTVGFGVLAFQQAQVRRQELAGKIAERFGVNKSQVESMIKSVETRIAAFDDQFEARIDATVGKLEDHLPEQAGKVLGQAHGVAKAARKQVRTLLTASI